jgi:hypothetical protein
MAQPGVEPSEVRIHFAKWGALVLAAALLAGGSVADAEAVEPATGTIVVTALDSLTGEPLTGICVWISDQAFLTTEVDGTVTALVAAGEHSLQVSDCDHQLYSSAFFDAILVPADQITTLDVPLHPPVGLSGVITNADTGVPLYRMCVDLFDDESYWNEYGEYTAVTDEAGGYNLTVTGGVYFMRVSDCGDREYVDLWLGSTPWSTDPMPLALSGAAAFVVDGVLTPAGFIAGTVTNEMTGSPGAGVCVSAAPLGEGGVDGGEETTGPDGKYRIGGLTAGQYLVSFRDCRGGDLIREYHLDAAESADATPVSVAAGATVIVDAALAPAASVAGTVTESGTGSPLSGVCVALQESDEDPNGARYVTTTDAAGHYHLDRVRPGSYFALFSARWCATSHLPLWFPGVDERADASTVILAAGQDVTGIDGAVTRGGSISGLVTNEAGTPITVHLDVHNDAWAEPMVVYAPEGRFIARPLPPGDYELMFWDGNDIYISEWYDDVLSHNSATPISIVTSGQDVVGVDATLTEGGRVYGHVVGLNYWAEIACVYVYDLEGSEVRFGLTGPEGSFHIGSLPTGTYRMSTGACPWTAIPDYLTIWYGGTLSAETSTTIDITAGKSTWRIDFVPTRFSAFDADSTVALVEPSGRWHAISGDAVGSTWHYGLPGDHPIWGDWDCDGVETPGVFRPMSGFFHLSNSRTTGVADNEFYFGIGGDLPVAGDWNGDGCDTVGVYRPSLGKVFLTNSLTTGTADVEYHFGRLGDLPFAGDFDGNGVDEIALHRATTGSIYLRFDHATGEAELDFFYGAAGDRIFAGDWDGDGTDSPGLFRPSTSSIHLTNTNDTSTAAVELAFGDGSLRPAG